MPRGYGGYPSQGGMTREGYFAPLPDWNMLNRADEGAALDNEFSRLRNRGEAVKVNELERAARGGPKPGPELAKELVRNVLSAPEPERPAVYEAARGEWARAGGDPSRLPAQYDPAWLTAVGGRLGVKDEGTVNVAPGHTVFDRRTSQPIYTAPAAERAGPSDRNAPMAPERFDQEMRLRAAGRASRPPASEPVVRVLDGDGNPVYMPRSQASGRRAPASGGRATGGLTRSQERDNEEIDRSRAILDEMGYELEDIRRMTAKATDTGRDNPDYNPRLDSLVRRATRRKVGDDPDFADYHRRFNVGSSKQAPAAAQTPPVNAAPPAPAAEKPPIQGAVRAPSGDWVVRDPRSPSGWSRVKVKSATPPE